MSQRIEIDFSYIHPTVGMVSVEALYTIKEPNYRERDSDWDYNGFQDLEYYAVFRKGKQVFVDIPDDVLYYHLREKLRNVEISGCFFQERGEI